MVRMMMIFMLALLVSFGSGCGETPERADESQSEAVDVETGEEGEDSGEADIDTELDIDIELPDISLDVTDPEVGQWISYGADASPEKVTISIVGSEVFQGDNCYWYQFEGPDFVMKLLADYSELEAATEAFEESWGEFAGDPAHHIQQMLETGGEDWATSMMGDEEALENGMKFLRALKLVVIEENGMLMAYDISGIAHVIEPLLENPEMLGSMTGFEMDTGEAGEDFNPEEIIETLEDIKFSAETTSFDVAGHSLGCHLFSVEYEPENVYLEIVFSNDLPIIPLAYAKVIAEGEEHFVEVVDFGWTGAVDQLPGQPVQTIDVSEMLAGFAAMAESGAMEQYGGM